MINYEATEPCVWHAKFCAAAKREMIMCMHTYICAWLYLCVFIFACVCITHCGTLPVGGEGWLAGGCIENSRDGVSEAFWSVISKSILIPKTWVAVKNLSWSFESCVTLKKKIYTMNVKKNNNLPEQEGHYTGWRPVVFSRTADKNFSFHKIFMKKCPCSQQELSWTVWIFRVIGTPPIFSSSLPINQAEHVKNK